MDVSKVCSFVVSKVNQVKTGLTGLLVAAVMSVTALTASAAPEEVTIAVPDINYGGVATSMLTALTPALVAAIGLGLSIWGISFIYRKFKSMGR